MDGLDEVGGLAEVGLAEEGRDVPGRDEAKAAAAAAAADAAIEGVREKFGGEEVAPDEGEAGVRGRAELVKSNSSSVAWARAKEVCVDDHS